KTDVVFCSGDNNGLTVFTNNGSGILSSNAFYAVPGSPFDFTAADVNNDGKIDLISADYNAGNIRVLTNNGTGTFVSAGAFSASGVYTRWVAVADLNGDNKPDVAVANYFSPASLSALTNSGNGTFSSQTSIGVGGWAFG